MQNKLFIGNLPFTMEEEELKTKLEEFGKVESIKIIKDRETGKSRGFGFASYETQAEAEKAIVALNNQEISGRKLRVNMADDKPKRGDRQRRDSGRFGNRGNRNSSFRRDN